MSLIVKRNSKYRGVYTTSQIKSGDIIEICDVLLLPDSEVDNNAKIAYYCFVWNDKYCALPLQNGALYNHSYNPNAQYSRNFKFNKITFTAIKDIKVNKEITINYNGDPNSKDPVEFY